MFSGDFIWWITMVDLPAMAGLLMLIWRSRRDFQDGLIYIRSELDLKTDQLREALSMFKLEVAKHYASQGDLRALEGRLVGHLLRIEAKLDATALKAERASTNLSKAKQEEK